MSKLELCRKERESPLSSKSKKHVASAVKSKYLKNFNKEESPRKPKPSDFSILNPDKLNIGFDSKNFIKIIKNHTEGPELQFQFSKTPDFFAILCRKPLYFKL